MRIQISYGLTPQQGGFPFASLPLRVEIDGGAVAHLARSEDGNTVDLRVDVAVDPSGLRLETNTETRASQGDDQEIPMVDVAEIEIAGVHARQVADAVSFLTRCPLTLSGKPTDTELIPDEDDDLAVLERLGTRRVFRRFSVRGGAMMVLPLVAQNISALCERPSGIRLYADALKMGTAAGKLRELWRVLEAGFGEKDDRLIELLATCEIATDMEFTREELKDLLILRGRASHAASRADIKEVAAVEHQAGDVLTRVQGLAEAMVVRKADWGIRTLRVNSEAPRYPYVHRGEKCW